MVLYHSSTASKSHGNRPLPCPLTTTVSLCTFNVWLSSSTPALRHSATILLINAGKFNTSTAEITITAPPTTLRKCSLNNSKNRAYPALLFPAVSPGPREKVPAKITAPGILPFPPLPDLTNSERSEKIFSWNVPRISCHQHNQMEKAEHVDGVLLRLPQGLERLCAEVASGLGLCVGEQGQMQSTRLGTVMHAPSLPREPERGLLSVCGHWTLRTVAICDESAIVRRGGTIDRRRCHDALESRLESLFRRRMRSATTTAA